MNDGCTARRASARNQDEYTTLIQYLLEKADEIGSTRPTAVNLMWAVKQMKKKATSFSGNVAELKIVLLDLANEIRDDDLERCHNLGLHGADIPIEERSPDEVTRIKGVQFTIEDIDVTTPAFDVTPAELIHGIITEKGVARYPYKESLKEQRNPD